jgi:hypothetical protein
MGALEIVASRCGRQRTGEPEDPMEGIFTRTLNYPLQWAIASIRRSSLKTMLLNNGGYAPW